MGNFLFFMMTVYCSPQILSTLHVKSKDMYPRTHFFLTGCTISDDESSARVKRGKIEYVVTWTISSPIHGDESLLQKYSFGVETRLQVSERETCS